VVSGTPPPPSPVVGPVAPSELSDAPSADPSGVPSNWSKSWAQDAPADNADIDAATMKTRRKREPCFGAIVLQEYTLHRESEKTLRDTGTLDLAGTKVSVTCSK
jgi:hypothetical protein